MTSIIYCIIIGVLLLLVEYFIVSSRYRAKQQNLLSELEAERKAHQTDLQRLEDFRQQADKSLAEQKNDFESRITALNAKAEEDADKRVADTKKVHEEALANERRNSDKRVDELKKSYEAQLEHERELRIQEQTAHEQRIRDIEARNKENLAMFKDSVKADTEQMLKQRSEELQKSNVKQMDDIFRPLRENITKMEETMKQNREAQVSDTSKLTTVMEAMISRTTEIGKQADELSSALRNQNKTMGNWGELILTQLLESQGLKEGVHFDAQKAMRDDSGELVLGEESQKRLIPDVILHLTDNREVIIDAKVSLKDFADYQNATTDEERTLFAQEHMRSMKNHVKELSGKDYSRYIPKSHFSSDFVIMFVPNEGAIQLMMATEPHFWDEAFNRYRVFIVGGQTLVAALHIIEMTWRQELQERNTQAIIEEARKLQERIVQFYERYQQVGKSLGKALEDYQAVEDKVDRGRQTILGSARRLEELGVKGKKALPEPKDEK